MNTTKKMGTIYVCDENGQNREPLNPNDAPYSYDDAVTCEVGDFCTLRKATEADGVSSEVDFVAINPEGEIAGYYVFVPTANA